MGYSIGDVWSMDLPGKIDFLHRVHTEEVSLWDEDGNDNEIWEEFHAVQQELLAHPERLGEEDLLHIMRIFDDDCFELSWQLNLAKLVYNNCLYYGGERMRVYLRHLNEVPPNGRLHGWHFPVQWFLDEKTFPAFQEAVREQPEEVQQAVLGILEGIQVYPAEKEELKAMIEG